MANKIAESFQNFMDGIKEYNEKSLQLIYEEFNKLHVKCLDVNLNNVYKVKLKECLERYINFLCIFYEKNQKFTDVRLVEQSLNNISNFIEVKQHRDIFLPLLLKPLLEKVIALSDDIMLSKLLLKFLNIIVQESDIKFLIEFVKSNTFYCSKLCDILPVCGDYLYQTTIMETLYRLCNDVALKKYVDIFFPKNEKLQLSFISINRHSFETDARKFLNILNEKHKNIYSIMADYVTVDNFKFVAPKDNNVLINDENQIWIDFNIKSKTISIFFDKTTITMMSEEIDDDDAWDIIIFDSRNIQNFGYRKEKVFDNSQTCTYYIFTFNLSDIIDTTVPMLEHARTLTIYISSKEIFKMISNEVLPNILETSVFDTETLSSQDTEKTRCATKSIVYKPLNMITSTATRAFSKSIASDKKSLLNSHLMLVSPNVSFGAIAEDMHLKDNTQNDGEKMSHRSKTNMINISQNICLREADNLVVNEDNECLSMSLLNFNETKSKEKHNNSFHDTATVYAPKELQAEYNKLEDIEVITIDSGSDEHQSNCASSSVTCLNVSNIQIDEIKDEVEDTNADLVITENLFSSEIINETPAEILQVDKIRNKITNDDNQSTNRHVYNIVEDEETDEFALDEEINENLNKNIEDFGVTSENVCNNIQNNFPILSDGQENVLKNCEIEQVDNAQEYDLNNVKIKTTTDKKATSDETDAEFTVQTRKENGNSIRRFSNEPKEPIAKKESEQFANGNKLSQLSAVTNNSIFSKTTIKFDSQNINKINDINNSSGNDEEIKQISIGETFDLGSTRNKLSDKIAVVVIQRLSPENLKYHLEKLQQSFDTVLDKEETLSSSNKELNKQNDRNVLGVNNHDMFTFTTFEEDMEDTEIINDCIKLLHSEQSPELNHSNKLITLRPETNNITTNLEGNSGRSKNCFKILQNIVIEKDEITNSCLNYTDAKGEVVSNNEFNNANDINLSDMLNDSANSLTFNANVLQTSSPARQSNADDNENVELGFLPLKTNVIIVDKKKETKEPIQHEEIDMKVARKINRTDSKSILKLEKSNDEICKQSEQPNQFKDKRIVQVFAEVHEPNDRIQSSSYFVRDKSIANNKKELHNLEKQQQSINSGCTEITPQTADKIQNLDVVEVIPASTPKENEFKKPLHQINVNHTDNLFSVVTKTKKRKLYDSSDMSHLEKENNSLKSFSKASKTSSSRISGQKSNRTKRDDMKLHTFKLFGIDNVSYIKDRKSKGNSSRPSTNVKKFNESTKFNAQSGKRKSGAKVSDIESVTKKCKTPSNQFFDKNKNAKNLFDTIDLPEVSENYYDGPSSSNNIDADPKTADVADITVAVDELRKRNKLNGENIKKTSRQLTQLKRTNEIASDSNADNNIDQLKILLLIFRDLTFLLKTICLNAESMKFLTSIENICKLMEKNFPKDKSQ